MSGLINFTLDKINKQMSNFIGWECPRCFKIHSPFSQTCDCPPRTYTTAGSATTFVDLKPCNHRWVRTTKNYIRVKKCLDCGEIKYPEPRPLEEVAQKVVMKTPTR